MSKICPKCGHDNRDVAIYCGNCGERIVTATPRSGNEDDNSLTICCCAVLFILFIIYVLAYG